MPITVTRDETGNIKTQYVEQPVQPDSLTQETRQEILKIMQENRPPARVDDKHYIVLTCEELLSSDSETAAKQYVEKYRKESGTVFDHIKRRSEIMVKLSQAIYREKEKATALAKIKKDRPDYYTDIQHHAKLHDEAAAKLAALQQEWKEFDEIAITDFRKRIEAIKSQREMANQEYDRQIAEIENYEKEYSEKCSSIDAELKKRVADIQKGIESGKKAH